MNLVEIVHRVELGAVVDELEVQVRPGRVASRADCADRSALKYTHSAGNPDAAQVSVRRLPAVAVVDDDQVAVAEIAPARVDDHTGVSGKDGVPRRPAEVTAGWTAGS